ncbi:MAG TPA: hypothetical protein VH482_18925 [Thermomicrobiales bacterium]|jgi:hypothetical protein
MDLRQINATVHRKLNRRPGSGLSVVGPVLVLSLLAGCAGPSAARTPSTATPSSSATRVAAASPTAGSRSVCTDGRLLVGDLSQMDLEWRAGLEAASAKALAWQADARLTRLRVGCQLFESGFRWQATFYSDNAQTFFATDTGETEPAEVAPEDVPTLPTDKISFGLLRRALTKSGYGDNDPISASTGVDLRLNTKAIPFGPPSAPQGALIYHVAIEKLGETKDVFVDGSDGTVYRYASP